VTPYEIKLLLHFYTTPANPVWENGDTIRDITIGSFLKEGLLEIAPKGYGCDWKATDKLCCYVEGLCALPLPVQVWEIPERDGR